MNCPTCSVTLQIAERQGVEIDFCPQCRGIWLDRGELDKIIERSTAELNTKPDLAVRDLHYDKHNGHRHGGHHRRKSFLHELFD